jgi:hypothetical protein
MQKKYLIDIFNENFNKTWPIEGYDVLIEEYNNYVSTSFLTKTEQKVNEVPFEVSVKGVWLNGPGIELHISLEDFSLLLFKGMR